MEDKYITIHRKGAVGSLVLHIVGDLLFESTFQNINEDVTWSFSCLWLQKIACPRKKKIIERLKPREYVIPLFILQRCCVTGSIAFNSMYNCGSKNCGDHPQL